MELFFFFKDEMDESPLWKQDPRAGMGRAVSREKRGGAGQRDPEPEQCFSIPQKPWLGIGILGSDGGDSSILTPTGRGRIHVVLRYLGCALQRLPACMPG